MDQLNGQKGGRISAAAFIYVSTLPYGSRTILSVRRLPFVSA